MLTGAIDKDAYGREGVKSETAKLFSTRAKNMKLKVPMVQKKKKLKISVLKKNLLDLN